MVQKIYIVLIFFSNLFFYFKKYIFLKNKYFDVHV